MKNYTIGIVFTPDLSEVILLKKAKPEWQKGKYNFPGGKTEDGETPKECIKREFQEECNISIYKWQNIGKIVNYGQYSVDVLTACIDKQQIDSISDEPAEWFDTSRLPENVISNIPWLLLFAKNTWAQGNADQLSFGTFEYKY